MSDIIFDTSIMKYRKRTLADKIYALKVIEATKSKR